jgi:SAM-dependent methyltransferase
VSNGVKLIIARYHRWKESRRFRKSYFTMRREPFYRVAGKYLPTDSNATVIDIGAGNGLFAQLLSLDKKYKNLVLLDGNMSTVQSLKTRFTNVVLYRAPERLPFEAGTVAYIHCSHLVEHLEPKEVYQLLEEIDRILAPGGVFVVSAPMLHGWFYEDLSHVRPYNHGVFERYLCQNSGNPSHDSISQVYSVLELVYRFGPADQGILGCSPAIVDLFIRVLAKLFSFLGIRRYARNGYTLVLCKGA